MARISEEMTAEFIRLHRLGQSNRAIAGRFEVDPRTVKSRIQRASQGTEKLHWENVLRQVDAKYLDEHYRVLVTVAIRLQYFVRTDPMFGPPGDDPKNLIERLSTMEMEGVDELLAKRGVDMDREVFTSTRDSIGEPARSRLVQKLFDALREHEPTLQSAMDEWAISWKTFQGERLSLGKQARGLFKGKHLNGEFVDAVAREMADSVMHFKLHGTAIGEFQIEEFGDEKACGFIVNDLTRKEIGESPLEVTKAVSKFYGEILAQLSHGERVRPVEEAYNTLLNSIEGMEGSVDTLVLKGRPEGQCRLCPGAVLQDSPKT